MNEKDLVTFEQAKKLKELGFNYPADTFLHQVQKWLREEKNIDITIDAYFPKDLDNMKLYKCVVISNTYRTLIGHYELYEEALSKAINHILNYEL